MDNRQFWTGKVLSDFQEKRYKVHSAFELIK